MSRKIIPFPHEKANPTVNKLGDVYNEVWELSDYTTTMLEDLERMYYDLQFLQQRLDNQIVILHKVARDMGLLDPEED